MMPRLSRLTEHAINLYWMANSKSRSTRECYRRTRYPMPPWMAAYVFEVWAIYDTILSEVKRSRTEVKNGN